MFHLEDVLHLHERERLLGVVRQHAVVLFRGLFGALLFIVFPFFFIFQLIEWGAPGMILFLFSILIGVLIAVRTVMLWNAHVLIATTDRLVLVHQRGLFSRFVTDVALRDIRDVQWTRRGIIDTLLKLGALSAQQEGTDRVLRFWRLARPQEFAAVVQEAKRDLLPHGVPTPGDLDAFAASVRNLADGERGRLYELLAVEEIRIEETVFPAVSKEVSEPPGDML